MLARLSIRVQTFALVFSDLSVGVSFLFLPARNTRKCNVCPVQIKCQLTVLSTSEPPLLLVYCRMRVWLKMHLENI